MDVKTLTWKCTKASPPPHEVLILLKLVKVNSRGEKTRTIYRGKRTVNTDSVVDVDGNNTLPFPLYKDYQYWMELK
jgi:hypothetical protein